MSLNGSEFQVPPWAIEEIRERAKREKIGQRTEG